MGDLARHGDVPPGGGIGTWMVGGLYLGAKLVGVVGTALVAVLAAPFLRPTSRGQQAASGWFALVVTAGFGAVAFVLAGATLPGP